MKVDSTSYLQVYILLAAFKMDYSIQNCPYVFLHASTSISGDANLLLTWEFLIL